LKSYQIGGAPVIGTSNPKPHQNYRAASGPLIPKFVSERAASADELRNRTTKAAPAHMET
jgi:hypothetical protein